MFAHKFFITWARLQPTCEVQTFRWTNWNYTSRSTKMYQSKHQIVCWTNVCVWVQSRMEPVWERREAGKPVGAAWTIYMVYNAGRRLGAPSGEEAFVSRRCLLLITPHWSPDSQPAILKRNKKSFNLANGRNYQAPWCSLVKTNKSNFVLFCQQPSFLSW